MAVWNGNASQSSMQTQRRGGHGNLNTNVITFQCHNPPTDEVLSKTLFLHLGVLSGCFFFSCEAFCLFPLSVGSENPSGKAEIKLSEVKDYSFLGCISISGCAFTALFAKKACLAWHHEDKNTEL